MIKMFLANLKMMVRGRQALFWSLFFPLMFTIIFGFFFGGTTSSVGTVALINNSNSELATNLEKVMTDSGVFKIQKETDLNTSKDLLKKSKVTLVVLVPQDFGKAVPNAPTTIEVIEDPANTQANLAASGFL